MRKAMIFLMAGLIPVVARAQELEVPSLMDGAGPTIQSRMGRMIIPYLEFADTPLEDAVDFLRSKSMELDFSEPDPAKKGINIVVKTPPGWSAGAVSLDDEKAFSFSSESSSPLINLKLAHVPLGEALRHVAEAAGLEMRVERFVVVLAPPAEDVASLIGSLDAAVGRLADGGEGVLPPTLFEALQSEQRVLEAQEARLHGRGVGEDDPRRRVLAAKLAVTAAKVKEARELLAAFFEKEKALAEAWVEAVGAVE